MGIGDMHSSLRDLSKEQRHALANLLNARIAYSEREVELNRLRLKALANPTEANEAAVHNFASAVTTPLREDVARQTAGLVRESIRADELMAFLPAALMGLLQFVNLPLMLTALGLEPTEADRIIEMVSEYINKDT